MITSIQQATAAYFSISTDEICYGNQSSIVRVARHVARYLEKKLVGRSYNEIAALYNNTDHTASHASVKHTTERLAANDALYVAPIEAISKAVATTAADRPQNKPTDLTCPTCGSLVIRELQRQLAEMREQMNEMRGKK